MNIESEDRGTSVRTRRPRRALLILVSAGVLVAAGAGIEAIASIPDAHGVIHGCYSKSTGALRVIDSAKHKCPRGTKALNWNQRGPRGPRGPRGALATTPINVSYTATRATAYTLKTNNVTLLLECGDNRIGANAANVAVYALSTHGVTTITETTSGSPSTTTEQIDAENGTPVALGDAYVGGTTSPAAPTSTASSSSAPVAIDYLHIWWTRDTRQNHPCAPSRAAWSRRASRHRARPERSGGRALDHSLGRHRHRSPAPDTRPYLPV